MPIIRSALRWMFLAVGLLLCSAPGMILRDAFHASTWAARLYPNSYLQQTRFVLFAAIGVMLVGGLCLLTSWGLKCGWNWAIWTGRFLSLLFLLGFPWLTPIGAIGFYFLFAMPLPPLNQVSRGDLDFWDSRRQSPFQWISSG